MSFPNPDALVGQEISGHRIDAVLGQGGMGVVYRGENLALGRTVALKFISPALAATPAFLERFRREARTLARIHHPNIVLVYDFRETDAGFFIAMEFVDGWTLADYLAARGPMPWADALGPITQILRAFAYAHEQGIIHRDVKPRNIMLTPDRQVKVTDFGLAKVMHDEPGEMALTASHSTAGTLHYMSPEQVRGLAHVDHQSDLFSLGLSLYELLAGALPFDRQASAYTIQKTIAEPDIRFDDLRTTRPDLPAALSAIVMKALVKDRALRYASAQAMLDDVLAFEADPDAASTAVPGDAREDTAGPPAPPLPPMEPAAPGVDDETVLYRPDQSVAAGVSPSAPKQVSAEADAQRRWLPWLGVGLLVAVLAAGGVLWWPASEPGTAREPVVTQPPPDLAAAVPGISDPAVATAKGDSAQALPTTSPPGQADPNDRPGTDGNALPAEPAPVEASEGPPAEGDSGAESLPSSSQQTPAPTTPVPAPLVTGGLRIASDPPGAQIYVNGSARGTTPLTLDELTAGAQDVRLELDGYEPYTATADITAGAMETLSADLAARMGTLEIQVRPWGRLYINGDLARAEVDAAIPFPVQATTHDVRIEHPSFGVWQQPVRVAGGETPTRIVVDFTATYDTPIAVATSDGARVFAEILVDGQPTGQVTPAEVALRVGTRRIAVRADGYVMATDPVVLHVDGPRTEPVVVRIRPDQ